MKNGMENAVWQMKQKEEDGLNYIYSQTYNFVYLRAKSILKNEEDIKLFMQTVYVDLYRSADEIQLDNLYEWLRKEGDSDWGQFTRKACVSDWMRAF